MPLCLGASGSERATSMHHFASWAKVVHTFWPVIRQPPPSLVAFVFSEARSEPDSGSENPWHQISSAERIGSRKRSFCSSVPCAITTGPPMTRPSTFAGRGAFARASSWPKIDCSISVAPRPPYSFGHETPAQPAACRVRCHARSSSRKACSSAVSVRSTAGKPSRRRKGSRARSDPAPHARAVLAIGVAEPRLQETLFLLCELIREKSEDQRNGGPSGSVEEQ